MKTKEIPHQRKEVPRICSFLSSFFLLYLLSCVSLPSVELIPTSMKLFRREREYKVVIKFVARANLHHLGQFLAGKRADAPKEALQILDIVLRELSTRRYEISKDDCVDLHL